MTMTDRPAAVTGQPATGSSVLRLIDRHRQFLLYAVIGCSGVLLDMLLFVLLYNAVGLPALLANLISTTCAISNTFLLNSFFNFRVRDGMFGRFLRFYAVGLTGIGLTSAILWLLHDLAGIDANIVKAVSLPLVLVFQYSANKRWSFG